MVGLEFINYRHHHFSKDADGKMAALIVIARSATWDKADFYL